MNIDYPIFKEVIGKDANFKNKKDVFAMMAIHYLLNANMIFDDNRVYEYKITEEGLSSAECYQSIKRKEDYDPTPAKFSKSAKIVFSSINDAITKTAEEYDYGPKTIVVACAALCFIKNNLINSKATDTQIRKYFNKKFVYLSGMYDVCEKALVRIDRNKKILTQQAKKNKKNKTQSDEKTKN